MLDRHDLRRLRLVAVRDRDRAGVILHSFQRHIIAARRVFRSIRQRLYNRVCDLLSAFIHRQVRPGDHLAVLRRDRRRLAGDRALHAVYRLVQLHRRVGRPLAVLVIIVVPGLRYLQLRRQSRVRELRFARRRTDRARIIGLAGQFETFSVRFCDRVGQRRRQAFRRGGLAALQLHRRHAILERHVTVGAADRLVAQRYREFELHVRIRCQVAHQYLAQFQITRVTGVREHRCARFRADRARIAGLTGHFESFSFRFRDLVLQRRRQALRRSGLAALQLHRCHAILERHVTISTADRLVAQRDRERELNVLIRRQVAHQYLAQFQIARVTRVLKLRFARRRADRAGITGLAGHLEAFSARFRDRVGQRRRQAFRRSGLAALQLHRRHAVRERHVAVGAADCLVAQRYREFELHVRIRCQVAHQYLAQFQIARITGVRELRFARRRADRARIAGLTGHFEAFSFRFRDLVLQRRRQICRFGGLAALQLHRRHAVIKEHVAKGAADSGIQRDREFELHIRVRRQVAYQHLAQFQIAGVAGIDDRNRSRRSITIRNLHNSVFRIIRSLQAIRSFLGNGCRQAGRQALDRDRLGILQFDRGNTIHELDVDFLLAFLPLIGLVQGGITQRDRNGVGLFHVGRQCTDDFLGNDQAAFLLGVRKCSYCTASGDRTGFTSRGRHKGIIRSLYYLIGQRRR